MSPDNRIIWRFMDFTKYVSMLHERALFFTRSDQLPDPFEGALSFRFFPFRPPREETPSPRDPRCRMLLSCWHLNDHESVAMWRIYSGVENGVAIRSTVARLRQALTGTRGLRVGSVVYSDETRSAGSSIEAALFRKRRSFEYEREIRALLRLRARLREPGRYVPADLTVLVDRVVVSPPSEAWFEGLIRSVSEKYGFRFHVTSSELKTA